MFSLHLAHKKEKTIAVLDIGSGSVGYCLVQIGKNAPPKILASERLVLPFEERTAEQAKSAVLGLLSEACEKTVSVYAQTLAQSRRSGRLPDFRHPVGMSGKGAPPISSSYAILRAPFVRSEFARAQVEYETDQRVTEVAIGGLAKQALASENKLNHQNLFEAGVVSVALNGYATKKPLGKSGHTVSVTALISECEPDYRAKVTEILQRSFPSATANLRSSTRALLSSLQKQGDLEVKPPSSRDPVIIDVENDATNCIVMRDGVVAENFLVPEGTRTILAHISTGLPEETLSLMRMISRGTCSTPACEKVNASLARIEPELVKIFGDALGRLVSKNRLPNELVLIAEPELSQWLSVFFSRIDFSQFTVTTKPFAPTILNSETPGAIDAGLALAVSFVNAEEQSTG